LNENFTKRINSRFEHAKEKNRKPYTTLKMNEGEHSLREIVVHCDIVQCKHHGSVHKEQIQRKSRRTLTEVTADFSLNLMNLRIQKNSKYDKCKETHTYTHFTVEVLKSSQNKNITKDVRISHL
jgi:hypothetical protein